MAIINPFANNEKNMMTSAAWVGLKNINYWVNDNNFSNIVNSLATESTLVDPRSSDEVADGYQSTRYSGLIDAKSIDDLSVNIYDSNGTVDRLGHQITLYKNQSTSASDLTNRAYVVSIENSGNIFVANIIYKVTYKVKYEMQYKDLRHSSFINYGLSNPNKYLSSKFCGTNDNPVSEDNHLQDFRDVLANLTPLCTNDYVYIKATTEELNTNFDAANLYEKSTDTNGNSVYTKTTDTTYDSSKTYYKVNDTYIYEIKNRLLKYLSDNPSGDYTITNLYKLLICTSNESFMRFLNAVYNENLSDIKTIYTLLLEELLSENAGYTYIADYIDKYHELGLHNTDTLITAGAVASDYENQYQQAEAANNSALLAASKLKALLEAVNVTYEGTSIQYINNDGTFDNDKFDALLKYIGLGGNNDVYGIYALSSSKGIKNGDFIPDNLNLESHNAYYKDSENGLELLPETSLDYAYWRKQGDDLATKYGDKYTGDNATTYSDSVNYAFLIEMKQLQKSIATTLFELDLNTSVATSQLSDYTMYSS